MWKVWFFLERGLFLEEVFILKIVVVLTVLFISIVSSSISAVIFTVYPDYLYFGGTFLGSGIGVVGSYFIFTIENRKKIMMI